MNQICKVCGEPAAGFHFGAFTCEGCKSFFGRSYNNLSSISECKNNGECIINKKNRTACKACRLRKCLLVGMSKSGSRYGRRSNWFKIHCLLQEQQQQAVAAVSSTHCNQKSTASHSLPVSMLGHSRSFPTAMFSQRTKCTKEEFKFSGIDNGKNAEVSPMVSSPDSHVSDNSIDLNIRNGHLLRISKSMDTLLQMGKESFPHISHSDLSSYAVMPPPVIFPAAHLLFPGYPANLYQHQQNILRAAASHSGERQVISESQTPNCKTTHFLSLDDKKNCGSNHNFCSSSSIVAEELTRRLYLEAVLNTQQNVLPPTTTEASCTFSRNTYVNKETHKNSYSNADRVVAMTPPHSPSSRILDNPIDLSMKIESEGSEAKPAFVKISQHVSDYVRQVPNEIDVPSESFSIVGQSNNLYQRIQNIQIESGVDFVMKQEEGQENELTPGVIEIETERLKPLDLTTRN